MKKKLYYVQQVSILFLMTPKKLLLLSLLLEIHLKKNYQLKLRRFQIYNFFNGNDKIIYKIIYGNGKIYYNIPQRNIKFYFMKILYLHFKILYKIPQWVL